MIYLDNCATTKPDPEVVDVMMKALTEDFANPSSLHSFGLRVEKEIEEARKMLPPLLVLRQMKFILPLAEQRATTLQFTGPF